MLPEPRLAELLAPYLGDAPLPPNLYQQLGAYLDLLLRWNSRTNLTAIRVPEEIVQRHFGESLFTGLQLKKRLAADATMLDFGSGAGFPGLPTQILLPELHCCLGESQGKKAAFLREVVRSLGLATEIWAGRIEDMPETRKFDYVALRAVDRMESALQQASYRLTAAGMLAILASNNLESSVPAGLVLNHKITVPGSHSRVLYLYRCE